MSRLLAALVLVFYMLSTITAGADMVTDWNTVTLKAIRTADTPAPKATRALAMVQAAVYDAVNSVYQQYEPYRVTIKAPAGTSPEAAAASAASTVLLSLYPNQKAMIDNALRTNLS